MLRGALRSQKGAIDALNIYRAQVQTTQYRITSYLVQSNQAYQVYRYRYIFIIYIYICM